MGSNRRNTDEKGSAIILVAVLMALMTFALIGYQMMSISYQKMMSRVNSSGQADGVARSGLVDALQWFRRHVPQPVEGDDKFEPKEAQGDTLNEGIGIVKEYPLSDRTVYWARYEIRKASVAANGTFTGVHDITELRTQNYGAGQGYVFSVQSNGYVYRRLSALVDFNQPPNQIVATSKVVTEFRRLTLNLQVSAAVLVNAGNGITLSNNSSLLGGDYGAVYYSGTAPVGSTISPPAHPMTDVGQSVQDISPEAVLEPPMDQIRGMADLVLRSTQTLPSTYPSNEMIFIDGSPTFDAAHPLIGSGLLFVNGNMTIGSTANALFSGLIYVTGNVVINGPALISGALIVQGGTLTCNGGADTVTIQYDSTVLNSLRQQIGTYHASRTLQYLFSGGITR